MYKDKIKDKSIFLELKNKHNIDNVRLKQLEGISFDIVLNEDLKGMNMVKLLSSYDFSIKTLHNTILKETSLHLPSDDGSYLLVLEDFYTS